MSVKRRRLLAALCLSVLAIWVVTVRVLAQPDGSEWAVPVNLSGSGAASRPVIVVVPDGNLRVLWWDEFDGLMVSDGHVSALHLPGETVSETAAFEGWSAPERVPIPSLGRAVPRIVGDADGRAHAFWLREPSAETGTRALLSSRLGPSATTWVTPTVLAGSAAALDATTDLSGTLHLAYVQPTDTNGAPVGLYYRQSRDGGATWTTPVPVFLSRYLRLLSDAQNDLRLTTYDRDSVYATWMDPQRGQVSVSHSADSGVTWTETLPYLGSVDQGWENQVLALPGGSTSLIWDRTGEGLGIMAIGASDDALTLAAWDGVRWSETRHLPLRFQDPQRGEPLSLSDVHIALAPPPLEQPDAGEKLVVVGIDPRSDLWISGIQVAELERLLASPAGELAPPEAVEGQEGGPPVAVNLSQSGAASNPAVASGLDNALRTFWWDRFDGLMIADGSVSVSSSLSGTQQIQILRDSWSEPRPLPIPAKTTPQILADARGRVHAFWLQESNKEQTAAAQGVPGTTTWSLLYSQLATDATAWLPAVPVAGSVASFDVVTDPSGTLHLAYLQSADTASSAAGVYYRGTDSDGTGWSPPVALDQSRYYRLVSPEAAHVRLAADDAGGVYVTWDEPRQGQLLLTYSPDGGATWQSPNPIVDSEGQARRGQLIAVPGNETLLVWEESGVGCNLYQAPASQVASRAAAPGRRILDALAQCPENAQFLPLGDGQILMVAGIGSDALILAIWDGERWSEPRQVGYSFTDPEMARQVYLTNLQVALVGSSEGSSDGPGDNALIVVGVDLEGDVWATSSRMGTMELLFAPLPRWSAPADLAQSEGAFGLPALASDLDGGVHVLWSEVPARGGPATLLYARREKATDSTGSGTSWTKPTTVSPVSDGDAAQPALIVTGDRLHAVWRGDQDAKIYYSQAFVSDAYLDGGWKEAQVLSAPGALASWPDIAADAGGNLHVVYAVPINEGRGIYYTRSDDGENWSEARQIFDAAGAGWAMSDYPRLAVGNDGALYVVWLHAAPFGNGATQEIYVACSLDGGEVWSEPLEMAEGAYAWPEIAAGGAGTVHLLWNETTGQEGWWHRWSTDGGTDWTLPERVPGFGKVPGPAGLLVDGNGTGHVVGLRQDNEGEPALLYLTWDGQRWGEREEFRLDLEADEIMPGVSAASLPALGKLDAVFRGKGTVDQARRSSLWHTEREIPVVITTPVPTITAQSAQTPFPTATPSPLPTPTRSFSQALPPDSGGSADSLLPLLLAGGLAALILAGVFGIGILRARRA